MVPCCEQYELWFYIVYKTTLFIRDTNIFSFIKRIKQANSKTVKSGKAYSS